MPCNYYIAVGGECNVPPLVSSRTNTGFKCITKAENGRFRAVLRRGKSKRIRTFSCLENAQQAVYLAETQNKPDWSQFIEVNTATPEKNTVESSLTAEIISSCQVVVDTFDFDSPENSLDIGVVQNEFNEADESDVDESDCSNTDTADSFVKNIMDERKSRRLILCLDKLGTVSQDESSKVLDNLI